jgi:hypothetical protein
MKAHAPTVSRILSKKFTRSKSEATRIRGWNYITEGFTVKQGKSVVFVEVERGNYNPKQLDKIARLQRMSEHLQEHGYQVQLFEAQEYLLVYEAEEVQA